MRDLRRDPCLEGYEGVCSIIQPIVGAIESGNAASAQEKAANQANQTLQAQYNQTRADLAPYNQGGQRDFSAYNSLLGQGSGGTGAIQSTLSSLPGYQFTLQQGLKSTQNAAAARGLGVSGAALKGASTYATGLANSTYGTYANQLLGGAQLGESAAAQTAQSNNAIVGAQASNISGAGNAAAAGDIGTANAINGGISNGLSSLYLFNALNKGASGSLYGSGSQGYLSDGSALDLAGLI